MSTHHYHYHHIPHPAGDDGDDITATPEGAQLAEDLILYAMDEDRRHPVTIGYWEQRKALRQVNKRDGTTAMEWKPVPGQFVRTVRTIEMFDVTDESGHTVFKGMDRCPRDQDNWEHAYGPPAIRSVRADRITSITVGNGQYRLKNAYFIERVRDHARAAGWAKINALTDDALWELIKFSHSREDAEQRAEQYMRRFFLDRHRRRLERRAARKRSGAPLN